MTELDWLLSDDPRPMLANLPHSTQRKLYLWCAACCRRVWDLFADANSRYAVVAAERYADGELTVEQLIAARADGRTSDTTVHEFFASEAGRACSAYPPDAHGCSEACERARYHEMFTHLAQLTEGEINEVPSQEYAAQAALLRDVYGNPFRSAAFDPSWRTSTAVGLARTMYESRDFAAMPILADALEEAGCDNADVLAHCRGDGPHVRGCWVADLVLGKA